MISKGAFEQLLDEYDRKRIAAENALEEKKAFIEAKIPEIKTINDLIASISVSQALARIKSGAGDPDYKDKILRLAEEKERLLKENGFSLEDLEPEYECSKCKDTGYVNDKLCSCFKRKIADSLYDQLKIRSAIEKENFRSFSLDYYSSEIPKGCSESPRTRAQKARDKAIDFVNNFASSKDNLFITGDVGVGKTFLTNCIVSELINRDYFVIYLPASKFVKLISDATFNRTETENDYITEHIHNCDLLVIDDLGTELPNNFVLSTLFTCINERLMAGKHTIISTNLSLEKFNDIYGSRIYSRIVSYYTCIQLLGDDIRSKKKLEESLY